MEPKTGFAAAHFKFPYILIVAAGPLLPLPSYSMLLVKFQNQNLSPNCTQLTQRHSGLNLDLTLFHGHYGAAFLSQLKQ
jgi:hypothetical protein